MNVLITYDISALHVQFKAKMKEKKYSDAWMSDGKKYNLPKSTLWKSNITLEEAKSDFLKCIREVSTENFTQIEVERLIIVPATPWVGIEGI